MKPIYLDYNATTPIDENVKKSMIKSMDYFGNASSSHYYGREAKTILDKARQDVADLINSDADEIIFTSGGTESNNLAIRGIFEASSFEKKHIIISEFEHPAVFEVCEYLKSQDCEISYLKLDSNGLISLEELDKTIKTNTILVSVMLANNELGTIQNVKEISKICKQKSIVFHSDASQAVGKIPIDVDESNIDLLTIAAHKFYGPKAVGALYINKNVNLKKIAFGASHEKNLRPGTENIIEIAGLGKAAELARFNMEESIKHSREMIILLIEELEKNIKIKINNNIELSLPNTLSVQIVGVNTNELLKACPSIATSTGSACHSGIDFYSQSLKSIGLSKHEALQTLRLSVGKYTTKEDIKEAVNIIVNYTKSKH
ncbi:MAG: cysteine desulfurase [Marinifilaceae bacterium]|jgi:cysteine desulfurase|nr:cysteine desulfurase [Marinifilaceae bacterium]